VKSFKSLILFNIAQAVWNRCVMNKIEYIASKDTAKRRLYIGRNEVASFLLF